jgi:FdhD protein
MEDVGRHNAVDKVIGKGLLAGVSFARSFLISTGRLSADIVVKCAMAGIPLVASKAAPLESGIVAAEMSGLTLVGFARGSRLNVYTCPERVEFR